MIRSSGGRLSEKIPLQRNRRAPAEAIHGNNDDPEGEGRQRIDRWLWHARLVRTRSAAAALASSGYVRVNGVHVDAPGRMVRSGDVITVALDRAVRVLKVTGIVERRGSARAGRALYEELT
jgi:ribosome-associated heat shock protein Hsp15